MNTQPTRSFARLAVAIVVAGVAIGAGILASSYLGTATTVTRTSTTTVTTSTFRGNSSATTTNSVSTSSIGSETFVTFETTLTACCNSTTGGGTFDYPLSIESIGTWTMHYWVQNYSGTENSIEGNLNGAGNSETWITFSVEGYVGYTLCASATVLPPGPPLTLSLFNQNTTTGSNPTVEVCGTMAV